MNEPLLGPFIEKLQKITGEISNLEKKASHCLHEKDDKAGYIRYLNEKTCLLVELPELLHELPCGLPASLMSHLKDQLGGVAFSAEKALALDSIFYMSALLYPENYQEGDKNDLENLLEQLLR